MSRFRRWGRGSRPEPRAAGDFGMIVVQLHHKGIPIPAAFADMVTGFRNAPSVLRLALLVSLLAYAPAAPAAPDTVRVTLESVLRRALETSPDLGEARAGLMYARARSRLARSSRFLTEFSGTTALSMVPGVTNPNAAARDALYLDPEVRNDFSDLRPFTQTEIELVQPILTWGRLGGSVRAAAGGVDVEAAAVRGKELDVALRAADLYYTALLAEELHRLTGRAGEIVERALAEIERLLESGDPEVDDADRYQLLITEQEFERRSREVAEGRLTARAALRHQLRESAAVVPDDGGLRPLAFAPEELETYLDTALRERPEIAGTRAGLAALDALVEVARAHYYPQLVFGLSGSVSWAPNRYRQPNPYVSDGFRRSSARTGFGFRQNLNFAQTRARVLQATAERQKVVHQADGAEALVLFDVERAWRDLAVARSALAAQDSSLAVSKEWLRVEYINFDLDFGDTENLIRAVQANLELEVRRFEAVRTYNMAVLRLLRSAGLLVRYVEDGLLVE